jgi:hypothetical protein
MSERTRMLRTRLAIVAASALTLGALSTQMWVADAAAAQAQAPRATVQQAQQPQQADHAEQAEQAEQVDQAGQAAEAEFRAQSQRTQQDFLTTFGAACATQEWAWQHALAVDPHFIQGPPAADARHW